ncbi:MAG: hypothetical protein NVSMB64_30840 [Candidatus Velthaea sp.]
MNPEMYIKILETIISDYAAFEGGNLVTSPVVPFTIGNVKVDLTLTVKKAA